MTPDRKWSGNNRKYRFYTVNILLVKTDQFKHEIRRNLLQIRFAFIIWTVADGLNGHPDGHPDDIIMWFSLTYEELNKQLIIESPKYDIWSLLSNIGVRVSTCPLAWVDFWWSADGDGGRSGIDGRLIALSKLCKAA